MFTGCLNEYTDQLLNRKFDKLFTLHTVEMSMRCFCHPVIPGHPVAQIDFLSQADFTDQLQITPNRTVAYRIVNFTDFIV